MAAVLLAPAALSPGARSGLRRPPGGDQAARVLRGGGQFLPRVEDRPVKQSGLLTVPGNKMGEQGPWAGISGVSRQIGKLHPMPSCAHLFCSVALAVESLHLLQARSGA